MGTGGFLVRAEDAARGSEAAASADEKDVRIGVRIGKTEHAPWTFDGSVGSSFP